MIYGKSRSCVLSYRNINDTEYLFSLKVTGPVAPTMTKVLLFIFTTIQVVSLSNSLLQTRSCLQRFSTALPAIGSDILQRPEDEESAEYRDYLKNLMKMQANRARSGHSAPSSGSSDAYFAKLSRLKVERQALARAGLPESVLDTSYTQEDYDSAM